MSMLTCSINRAGQNLAAQKRVLEQAKHELRAR
jgi:hypothetical protein